MILTCPACDTKYVVKDGAIPPGGRKVRCASCKHSWHQDPDDSGAVEPVVENDPLPNPLGAPASIPEPDPVAAPAISEPTEQAIADDFVAEVPEPETAAIDTPVSDAPAYDARADEPLAEPSLAEEATWEAIPSEPAPLSERQADPLPVAQPVSQVESHVPASDDDYVGYVAPDEDEEPRKRRWPLILGLLLILAAAAAAFWFLAPQDWRAKAGIAQAGASPLKLEITTHDRQPLNGGNTLVAVSGKVINPTNSEQDVPPIMAELRNASTKKLVHRWTIAPPARVLSPNSSASFNSAEIDVPADGDLLTVRFGA